MDTPRRKKLTAEERKTVHAKFGGHCAYCGTPINLNQMQVDHLIPMTFHSSYLGEGIDIDTMENYMPACRSCNKIKSCYTLEKFRKAIEHWPEVLARDSATYRDAVRFGMVEPKQHPVVFYFERFQNDPQLKPTRSGIYRYFFTMRPPSLGTQPRYADNFCDYCGRKLVEGIGREAWGWVEYDHPLTVQEQSDYELIPSPLNPDTAGRLTTCLTTF